MASGETLQLLLQGIANVSPQSVIMLAIASVLLYLGIARNYEPLLLVPIGAGCLLANLPLSPLITEEGMLRLLYHAGVANEVFPLLIFIGIGALTDFGPLLENPRMVLLGVELRIDLVGAICRVLNLIPHSLAVEQAGLVQTLQLLVERPGRGAGQARDLAHVQTSLGV
jgi:Na+-transporting methylmalonyl-CoA/oxaloacetate decarboxylase beta subunit